MHRVAGVLFVLLVGGGGAPSGDPFGRNPTATNTPTQQVLGARDEATPTGTTAALPTPPGEYTVVEGDTLSEIAARFGTDTATLVALNQLVDADAISIGQVLRISGTPAAATVSPTVQPSPTQ